MTWEDALRALAAAGTCGNIPLAVGTAGRRFLFDTAVSLGARDVLEIGTHAGTSALTLALAVRDAGGLVTTVDIVDALAPDGPWSSAGLPEPPDAIARRLGAPVRFVRADSLAYLRDQWVAGSRYNIVFLDGLHNEGRVYRELIAASAVLGIGRSAIILHDVFPEDAPVTTGHRRIPGPFLAAKRFISEMPSWGLRFVEKYDGEVVRMGVVSEVV